ncbi:MAG: hypothetical protein JNM34_00580 [Chthonomonadaceae bacterium]|nr:hypothetical protein [Chthonomonadaceae bacterium]
MTKRSPINTRSTLARMSGFLVCTGVAVWITAQTQSIPQLSDKRKQFALYFQEASTEFPDKNTIDFDVSGSPVHGYSKSQNLEFAGQNMTGRIKQRTTGKDTAMHLERGTLTGNATVTVADDKGATTKFVGQKVSVEDDGESAKVTVPAAFTVTSSTQTESGQRVMTVTAKSGTFILKSLSKKDDNPLTSAIVVGPVTLRVDQKAASGKANLYTITGDRLTMRSEGDNKIVTLSGHVHVSSDTTSEDGGGFIGQMDVETAIATLDKANNMTKLSTKGAPGSGQLKEKSGG